MAKITNADRKWTNPDYGFQIIHANVDTLMMDVLDVKRGDLFKIKCESILEWIRMTNWNDGEWLTFIETEDKSE